MPKSPGEYLTAFALLMLAAYFSISLTIVYLYHALPDVRHFRESPLTVRDPFYQQLALSDLRCRQYQTHELNQLEVYGAVFFKTASSGCSLLSRELGKRVFYEARGARPGRLEEALMAIRLENELDKKTLLSLYIDEVYLADLKRGTSGAIGELPVSMDDAGHTLHSDPAYTGTEITQLVQEMNRLIGKPGVAVTSKARAKALPVPTAASPKIKPKPVRKKAGPVAPKPAPPVPAANRVADRSDLAADTSSVQPVYSETTDNLPEKDERPERPGKRWRKVKAWVRKSWKKVKTTAASLDL